MSPSEAESKAKRATTLEQLRSLKNPSYSSPNAASSSSSPANGSLSSGFAVPPSQSRDATMSSRFFPPAPPTGAILVPSSSPLSSTGTPNPYQPYGQGRGHDVAHNPGYARSTPWGYQPSHNTYDPLTASSGFINTGNVASTPARRPWASSDAPEEEGPPRKRINRGLSPEASTSLNSPGSPDIQRAGQRRRVVSSSVDNVSNSSDELPEVSSLIPGSSKSRLVRDRPETPNVEPRPPLDPFSDPKFTRFKMTMPGEATERVKAAWTSARGDVKRATEFVTDRNWTPTPAPKPKVEPVGRVNEVIEATKVQRNLEKEKGKKSMIYANRPVAKPAPRVVTPPPPVKTVVDLTVASPITPLPVPSRKRARKAVIDSESEMELTDSDDDDRGNNKREKRESIDNLRALEYFNTKGPDALQELTGCSMEQAKAIINLRPFESTADLNIKLGQGKKKAGPGGISPRMIEECTEIFAGYGTVDTVLEDCEKIGAGLRKTIASWSAPPAAVSKGKGKEGTPLGDIAEDGALSLRSFAFMKNQKAKDYLTTQPSLVSDSVQLKEYQLLGVNWLNLLYNKELSCILADEMGLGKTIQVISFFAYLKEKGNKGPHLIVVPASTLENWCREFARFAPSISVQTYYGTKDDRVYLRQTLLDTQRHKSKNDEGWDVLITTYTLAQGDNDRKFFRRIQWDSCVFDEGHVLKNFQSQRYQALLKVESKWRLLLTGTPLQNNLQELVSLMNFILPGQFAEAMDSLRAIFKTKGDSKVTLLAQERVSRAKKMMTPFVLRRRKDQVLKDLPKKTERIEWCEMTALQTSIYRDAVQRSRKTVCETEATTSSGNATEEPPTNGRGKAKKARPVGKAKDKVYLENSSNVLMDLRKAASHPMLFRTQFTDEILSGITKQLLKEPDFKKRGALFDIVKEDMTVMTDAELQVFCGTYKSIGRYLQDDKCYVDAGKVQRLLKLLDSYGKEGRKVLIFSQFTQVLDILKVILRQRDKKYLLLTGSTPVDVRQTLVDEFTEDDSICVFLLSTKAGGMGINLTAASVVIMFDQDFNPHNDRQAQDRAYRIGQKRDVDVVKLISRGTIEEDMLRLGETKLALDEAVAGEGEEKGESAPEREMKMSLMNSLRQQFEKQEGGDSSSSNLTSSTATPAA